MSNEITFSDYPLIRFSIACPANIKQNRKYRKTDWDSYIEEMEEATSRAFGKFSMIVNLKLAVDQLQQAIFQSYYRNCKVTVSNSPRLVHWWSKEISRLRRYCRKLFNGAKKNGDWDTYKSALTKYNKAIRDAKRNSWRQFCDEIGNVPTMARVLKFTARDRNFRLNIIKLPNSSLTNSGGETLVEMLKVYFPNSEIVSDPIIPIDPQTINCGRDKSTIAEKIITYDRVFWAITSFKPFKIPGMYGIFPALLQKSIKVLAPILCRIFRACIAFELIPTAWRHTKVVFIPKVGKGNYFEAKSFRPISLKSFF